MDLNLTDLFHIKKVVYLGVRVVMVGVLSVVYLVSRQWLVVYLVSKGSDGFYTWCQGYDGLTFSGAMNAL